MGSTRERAVEDVAPQLDADRYRRMLEHFDRIGPSGARMMRQTASFQVCVDGGDAPELHVDGAQRAGAVHGGDVRELAALCGSGHGASKLSPTHLGDARPAAYGHARRPGRSASRNICEFALAAPAFLLPDVDGAAAPFSYWLARGGDRERLVHAPLTLFPRSARADTSSCGQRTSWPRNGTRCRSCSWRGSYHRPSLDAAADLLGAPNRRCSTRSGRVGLADPVLREKAPMLCDLALDGCSALGTEFVTRRKISSVAAEYFERYTRRGARPADDV